MDWKQYLVGLNLDSTTHCNARCVACSRNDDKNNNEKEPWLPLTHMSLDLWTKIAKESRAYNIQELIWNGSWGDAGMNPNLTKFLEIWGYCHPKSYVEVNTNGGTHNEKWWAEVGKMCNDALGYHRFVFAIDGVGEESHAKYRRFTSYEKIIKNVKAFSDEGGYARWTMTLFDHNVNQVEEALEAAKEIGCCEFEIRRSQVDDAHYIDENGNSVRVSALNVTGEHFKRKSFLSDHNIIYLHSEEDEPPTKKGYKTSMMRGEPWDVATRPKSLGHQCHWYDAGKLQIDPWGNLWPCCHTADSILNPTTMKKEGKIEDHINPEDIGFNNLEKYTMDEILSHPWYVEQLDKVVNKAELGICVENCSVKKII